MRKKTSMIICALTLLFISGCNKNSRPPVSSSETQTALVETPEAIAIEYMKEKYDLDCIVIQKYLYPNYSTGGSYYKLWMRSSDDVNGEKLQEKAGQDYLDYVNNAQQYGSAYAAFIDATPENKDVVIGDQYMWYTVYSLFDKWINEQTARFSPCQLYCGYLDFCTTEWEYKYCFSPDFPIITNFDELEKELSFVNVSIRAFYSENLNLNPTDNEWKEFQSHLEENYPFKTFGMRIREVPESIYQKLVSDEIMFRRLDLTSYPSCVISFENQSVGSCSN